jgi:hypothetical protein
VDFDPEVAQGRQRRRVGAIGPRDGGAELRRHAGVAAHAGPAEPDQVQPPSGPGSFVACQGARQASRSGREPAAARPREKFVYLATFAVPARWREGMQPVSPHRWRALPTLIIVVVAIALGAATARAADAPAHPAAASTSSAIR